MFKRCMPFLLALCALGALCAPAFAEEARPGWMLTSRTYPTVLSPAAPVSPRVSGTIAVDVFNVGAAASHGPITVTDKLPVGLVAVEAGELTPGAAGGPSGWIHPTNPKIEHSLWDCSGNGPGGEVSGATEVTCVNNPVKLPEFAGGGGHPTFSEDARNPQPIVGIAVDTQSGHEGTETNRVEIQSPDAPSPASTSNPVTIGSVPPPFGFVGWDGWFSKRDGEIDTQAGSHPYEFTTSFDLASILEKSEESLLAAGGEARNIEVELPPGFVGDPTAVPQCPRALFHQYECPVEDEVGTVGLQFVGELTPAAGFSVYNLAPRPGVAAEFGFSLIGINTFLDSRLRSGADYGIDTEVDDAAQKGVSSVNLTLWGFPEDESHTLWRSGNVGGCSAEELASTSYVYAACKPIHLAHPKPFLRLPTSCGAPLPFVIRASSWLAGNFAAPATFYIHDVEGNPVGIGGCDKLPFRPGISSKPTTDAADSPAGLDFDLHIPQPEEERDEGGVGEADLKDATISFPAGLAVNPSEADGLQACSEQQVGFTGFAELNKATEAGVQTPQFTPEPATCPGASKLGLVKVKTPLLNHELEGSLYLARQGENPFGSLLAIYIAVYDPISGVVVKLPGEVKLNPQTGQVSTVVDQSPQLPFEDFKIGLFNGSRAPFTTPFTCGSYSTTSSLTPWSAPEGATVSPSDAFEVTGAPGGGVCPVTPAQEPNSPAFSGGTFTPIAGAYSPFVFKLAREDGSQTLSSLSLTLPEGLLGKIAGIEKCPRVDIEAAEHRDGLGEGHLEREAPSCPSASEIGLAHVGAGSGAPFYAAGHAYLAGPYEGAPFSVVVITPAVAGPFDLGTVVVRSALSIDRSTAQVTVRSDPFPTILDGIPLDIRSIAVEIIRPGFTLNPTSCERMSVTGTVFAASSQAALSSPFQVGGCDGLPFKPSFTAGTKGKASKASGASLTVTVSAHPGEANVHRVDVQLPVQLPARLTTLQRACTETQFDTNPAGCPPASDVATAMVRTPLLNVPLTGPVYFVSHGGAAFPDLEVVLQGEGVTIELTGNTDIKKNVTYSRFEAIPDAPFSSFELNASQGPDSILAVNLPARDGYDLCGQSLMMPTILTGQNGVVVTQDTKIQTTGCPKSTVRKLTRAQRLKAALKACRTKDRGHGKRHEREACERKARKRYGPVGKGKQKHNKRR
jgi:hypothetical protein